MFFLKMMIEILYIVDYSKKNITK